MAKRKMFKQMATLHLEDLSDVGNWNSFLDILKQQDQFKSAYIDKVRISFLQDESLTWPPSTGSVIPWVPVLFAAHTNEALEGSSSDSDFILASGASRGGGGTVTLDIKRRIVLNQIDPESGEAAIRLSVKNPNVGVYAEGNLQLWVLVETYGRWHTTKAL